MHIAKYFSPSPYEETNAEYLVYTNVDIALMPYFYSSVCKLIEHGLDAFVIIRRTISKQYLSVLEPPDMYTEIGQQHLVPLKNRPD